MKSRNSRSRRSASSGFNRLNRWSMTKDGRIQIDAAPGRGSTAQHECVQEPLDLARVPPQAAGEHGSDPVRQREVRIEFRCRALQHPDGDAVVHDYAELVLAPASAGLVAHALERFPLQVLFGQEQIDIALNLRLCEGGPGGPQSRTRSSARGGTTGSPRRCR
jgi:hypothetical protein